MARYHGFFLGLCVLVMCVGCNDSTSPDGDVGGSKNVELQLHVSDLDGSDELIRTKNQIIREENGVIVFRHDQGEGADVAGFVSSPVGSSEWDDFSTATEPSKDTLFHGVTEDGWVCIDLEKTADMIRAQVAEGESVPGSFYVTGGYRPRGSGGTSVGFGELRIQVELDNPVDLRWVYAKDKKGGSTFSNLALKPSIDTLDGIVICELYDPEGDPLQVTASFACTDCTPAQTVVIEYDESDDVSYHPAYYNPFTRQLMLYFDSADFSESCTYDMTLDVVSNGKHASRSLGQVYMDAPNHGGSGGYHLGSEYTSGSGYNIGIGGGGLVVISAVP